MKFNVLTNNMSSFIHMTFFIVNNDNFKHFSFVFSCCPDYSEALSCYRVIIVKNVFVDKYICFASFSISIYFCV